MKMIKFLVISLLIITIAVATATAQKLDRQSAGRPPGSQPAQVNLNVVIDDLASQGLYGFGSDGGGAYVNGSQGVAASFLSTGVLSFRTGNRTATAYASTVIDGDNMTATTTGSAYFLTFVHSSPALYLQTMAIGSSRCEGLIGSMPISAPSGYARYVGYRAGQGTITNTGYMLVTHPDANTWVMDSNSGTACNQDIAYNDVARINDGKTKGPTNTIFHGRYYMPLRLVLTRQ